GTRLLTLVAATGSLAQAATDAATNTLLGVSGACGRLDCVQFHVLTLNLHQVSDLMDHAADRRRVFQNGAGIQSPETQAAHSGAVLLLGTDQALDERDLDLLVSHGAYSRISATDLPRLAAISDGVLVLNRPFSVARTTLYGLVEPRHLATTSVTPITSNTARIWPPAMMPVPGEAGCIRTTAAPCLTTTVCSRVPDFRLTLFILRRASSIAFCTATGTSRDLPLPMPTAPSPSPTT